MNLGLLIVALALMPPFVMAVAWIVAIRTGRSGWVDAIWSFAVGITGIVAALTPLSGSYVPPARQFLVAMLTAIWSSRLGLHIVRRTLHGGDDPRYVQLRQEWGASFRGKFFWFLQIQAATAVLLVVSIFVASRNPAPALRFGDALGVLVLVAAVVGEGAADRQLARFRADPSNKDRVCDAGLWSLSRHPNYFFEWLGWCAYTLIAIDPGGGYGWGWLALSAPAFMYWLLVRVSGVPPLEAHMLRSRGAAFAAYQARTNAFWPGPARPAHPSPPRRTKA